MTWAEQDRLFGELQPHLRDMAELAVQTGARDNVIVNLRWDWVIKVDEFDTTVIAVPKEFVKGRREDKLLILNSKARAVLDRQRGRHAGFVFVWRRERVKHLERPAATTYAPIKTINNTGWQSARQRAGLPDVHVHDLRATFANRLAAAGVPEATIAELMWHSRRTVTRRYMVRHLSPLIAAVERIAVPDGSEEVSIASLRKAVRPIVRLDARR